MSNNKPIQISFCELLKKYAKKYPDIGNKYTILFNNDIYSIADRLFYNLHYDLDDSLKGKRLTYKGKNIIDDFPIKCFSIDFNKELKIKLKHLRWFENNATYPYYIGKKNLTLLEEENYTFLAMNDYDLDKLI